MTLRESKASFAIEGEGENEGRVQRFADVMARRTGAIRSDAQRGGGFWICLYSPFGRRQWACASMFSQ